MLSGRFKRNIISLFRNFRYWWKNSFALLCIIEQQTEAWTTSARGYHMSGGFRVDGVPSLWERRYNLSSADSFLSSLDFPAMKTPSSDVLLLCTASLYRYFLYRSLSLFLSSPTTISSLAFSSFLFSFSIAGFFFLFFGSATVPLAARESPLTRRMDDLRISSRSLSLVRSRYRSRSSVSSILSFSPSRSFRFSFFFPGGFSHRFHDPTRSSAFFVLSIAKIASLFFVSRGCALWRTSHPRSVSRQINSRRHGGAMQSANSHAENRIASAESRATITQSVFPNSSSPFPLFPPSFFRIRARRTRSPYRMRDFLAGWKRRDVINIYINRTMECMR